MSISNHNTLLQNIEKRYLNPDGADVWFIFDGERIPGHRIILASSPWLENMFFGSLTESGEVNMNNSNVSSRSFKEFLRYVYTGKANLTMDNIREMMYLADESLDQEIFDECENFLIKEITVDNIFSVYQLALRHERAGRLKTVCEEEICVNAETTFKSASFEQIQYDFLENILKCDSLVCEEKDIFDACIGWAKAACRRNGIDQHNPLNVRAQVGESLYQIRFGSMTIGNAATCITSCPGLFSADELQEIMCLVGHKNYSGVTRFNWTPRYFSLKRDASHELMCNRYSGFRSNHDYYYYSFHKTEFHKFTCNRRVLLKGFTCECDQRVRKTASYTIVEMNSVEDSNIRCNERKPLEFFDEVKRSKFSYSSRQGQCIDIIHHKSYKASVKLNNAILIRPGYTYTMNIEFEKEPQNLRRRCFFKNKVRVDHDIVFQFYESKGIVSSIMLSRLDNRKYFRKIVHNPMMWFKLILVLLVIAYLIQYDISQPNSKLVHLWHFIKSLFKKS
ncbi:BTB/POZ domain-containing protein 6-like [Sitodiplosis mosellana]|uniref:BTB/POZ domain-containing protein 6-like n=1 Tax=Sitodiplosis mosellana TaxID=263140 RepID=UPI002443E4FE|nr:BTB/POZ domain-containing protein 6-like [Sitodiplosis mosellana]